MPTEAGLRKGSSITMVISTGGTDEQGRKYVGKIFRRATIIKEDPVENPRAWKKGTDYEYQDPWQFVHVALQEPSAAGRAPEDTLHRSMVAVSSMGNDYRARPKPHPDPVLAPPPAQPELEDPMQLTEPHYLHIDHIYDTSTLGPTMHGPLLEPVTEREFDGFSNGTRQDEENELGDLSHWKRRAFELEAESASREQRIKQLESQNASLEARVRALEGSTSRGTAGPSDLTSQAWSSEHQTTAPPS